MPVSNPEIADLFDQLADLLEIEGANPFRIRAYRNAARTVRSHPKSMADLVAAGEDLSALPTIGEDLAGKIAEIVETGKLPLLEEVASRTPRVLSELTRVPGLGPKRVQALYKELKVRSLQDLKRAAESGRISELPGFGRKTQDAILSAVEGLVGRERRFKRPAAEAIAEPLVAWLESVDGVKSVTLAGSYRRCRETVGDLDVLVTATKSSPVMRRFVEYEDVADVVSQGTTRSTVRLRSGMQVDLRVVPQVSFGAALHYFTGSKAHNIAVRSLAARKGLKLNEYGLFRGEKRVAGRTEKELFGKLGLVLMPPELREDHGEIKAAANDRLPDLIEVSDIRGDLHCHTSASDGHDSLEAMAEAAAERGYEYLAITDHSKHVTVAHGLDEGRLRRQIRAIDRLNEKLDGLRLLKSAEVDILEDGSLDLPDKILAELDLTVCAVHYQFGLSRAKQTERILRAMDNPYFTILAHPTGRLLEERAACALDLERVLEGAKERGRIMELNAHPDRLDLDDEACRLAAELGVRIAISTDAHRAGDLGFMRYGVDQARRGWLSAGDVVNTLGLPALSKALGRH